MFGNIAENTEIFASRQALNSAAKLPRVSSVSRAALEGPGGGAAQGKAELTVPLSPSSAERLLSEAELGTPESPVADKKAPGSERAAERAAAAQHNSERARLASQPSFVNMQVGLPEGSQAAIHLADGSEAAVECRGTAFWHCRQNCHCQLSRGIRQLSGLRSELSMQSLENRKALLLLLSKKNLGTENCVAVFVFTSIISLLEILDFLLERITTAKHVTAFHTQ